MGAQVGDSGTRPYPTVPEIEAALGALVVAFSEIEFRIQHLIWALLDDEEVGQIVTSGMSFKQAAGAAEQLWHLRIPEDLKRRLEGGPLAAEVHRRDPNASDVVDYVFRSVRNAEQERNKLLHSWWPDPSEPYWLRVPPLDLGEATIRWKADRKTKRFQSHKVPLAEIRETADKFLETGINLAVMVGMAMGTMKDRRVTR